MAKYFQNTNPLCRLYLKAIDFFFPLFCLNCEKKIQTTIYFGFCKQCFRNLDFIKQNKCIKCGRETAQPNILCSQCKGKKLYYDRCISPLNLNQTIKNAIIKFKYKERKSYAYYFAKLMAHKIQQELPNEEINKTILTYVPLSWKKKLIRGFNQSELIANNLSKTLLFSKYGKYLKKVRNNESQTALKLAERQKNVKNVYAISTNRKNIKGKTFIIIDDIFTTGSTINECAKILKKFGAKKVIGATIASGIIL